MNDPIDEACRKLRELCAGNVGSVELHVRADGRVVIGGFTHAGFVAWQVRGDLVPGGAHELPSVELARRAPG